MDNDVISVHEVYRMYLAIALFAIPLIALASLTMLALGSWQAVGSARHDSNAPNQAGRGERLCLLGAVLLTVLLSGYAAFFSHQPQHAERHAQITAPGQSAIQESGITESRQLIGVNAATLTIFVMPVLLSLLPNMFRWMRRRMVPYSVVNILLCVVSFVGASAGGFFLLPAEALILAAAVLAERTPRANVP